MKNLLPWSLLLVASPLPALDPPAAVVARAGDQSVVLHWSRVPDAGLTGYRVYRATTPGGPFTLRGSTAANVPNYADLLVVNNQTNYFQVRALAAGGVESAPSETVSAVPREFANDDEFLEYVQRTHFEYFWYGANPTNGLVPDRFPTAAPCSIAAVGFGLSALCIGADHGWISRAQALGRVRTTLSTFHEGPQGPEAANTIGYRGWFYHFLDLHTAARYVTFNTELSSIDTALLLAGMLDAKQFFDQDNPAEAEVRGLVDAIFNRVDWPWMARGSNVFSMGWLPGSGFLDATWNGYNEAMILLLLGMGAATNPVPAATWARWTNTYTWQTHYGQSFVPFPPLFGHQYSHCWVDFRHVADGYMNARRSTYFENSRRAALAQRAYCIANPAGRVGYGTNVWGITASDGPWGYAARGAPPAQNDDGTIAPTAAAASVAFTPEFSVPAMRHFYRQFRRSIWTPYGYRDAFNQGQQWWGPDTLGIDQGPIVLMIENYRTQRPWRRFMRNPEIQRGLQAAGFVPLSFMRPVLQPLGSQMRLTWSATVGQPYRVEYSPDLDAWFGPATGDVLAASATGEWTDNGPPGTPTGPLEAPQRFYRVFQLGWP